jgi:UDP-N-acetylmuramoylalanine--D-glutamate ligase
VYNIGIVGFGIVGKSLITFFKKNTPQQPLDAEQALFDEDSKPVLGITVWDKRPFSTQEIEFLNVYNAGFVDGTIVSLEKFIKEHDFVVVSPGIDLAEYQQFKDKFLCELDFFPVFFKKPVLAITGSVGKTTTTRLITALVNNSALLVENDRPAIPTTTFLADVFAQKKSPKALMGGNVGIGMLDLLAQQEAADLAVLELSSFQLELNKKFAPDIALWTNFIPNHLDRHKTIEQYFAAKAALLLYQHRHQAAIVSREVFEGVGKPFMYDLVPKLKSTLVICSTQPYDAAFVASIPCDTFYYVFNDNGVLVIDKVEQGRATFVEWLIKLSVLPDITFISNWSQALTAVYLLGADMRQLEQFLTQQSAQNLLADNTHRLTKCATINGVDFYNDSKSTLMLSTLAAAQKLALNQRPLIVIVGGLGKGVDRSPLMAELTKISSLKKVYCYGPECSMFAGSDVRQNLEDILHDIVKTMKPGDQVLFSPSGASFDAYKNFEQRGTVFTELVKGLAL